ncbi:redox-sensing transcriptional repressor Rex [Anaerocolumna cellulosilytica]|uniref:Redox-sensing transcriptional repressor Rex n=1 Tax=Anaerocolumna cellulosilytica TaxID=433286 RepID=A0A6S6R2L2_9FIRM|nr:redox-sensing transcriptional repressor Rex [Anaerocolumna cellulosilytica]MBB5194720.1 redox-sensing transcriptional repressor [Anaerocolumna cellulosilytica]BCJ94317.1 redox-sensing transcriptional repressor Rex [Anaerocolumna cellulosilytica]
MKNEKVTPIALSTQALERMPYYLHYIKQLQKKGITQIASPAIAADLGLNEVQVRKDLAAVSSSKGKPKAGFYIQDLIYNMEELLGYHNVKDAVLVGAGSLGKALLSYKGFEISGMHIVAAFDNQDGLIDTEINGKKVLPVSKLSSVCRRLNIHIGIITVPANQAQTVCDQMVAGGILAIWNFSPIRLTTPEGIMVRNENMAASLAILSQHLKDKLKEHML